MAFSNQIMDGSESLVFHPIWPLDAGYSKGTGTKAADNVYSKQCTRNLLGPSEAGPTDSDLWVGLRGHTSEVIALSLPPSLAPSLPLSPSLSSQLILDDEALEIVDLEVTESKVHCVHEPHQDCIARISGLVE